MESQLLKTLLCNDTFKTNRPRLKRSIFSEDAAELFDLMGMAHDRYNHDLSTDDLLSLWLADHPIATNSEKADFMDLLDDVRKSNEIAQDIAHDVIDKLWRKEIGRQVSSLGINMAEGDNSAMGLLRALLDRVAEDYSPDDFGDPTTKDLDTLLAKSSNDNRWEFNIRTLSRHLYGVGSGEFLIVLARPETGKTTFLVSLCAGPGGFCEQGAKVLILGNEEETTRTMLRSIQAAAGMTRDEIAEDPSTAMIAFNRIADNLDMQDTVDWDLDKIDSYMSKMKPDVLIIDQADKVGISGQYTATHERLRELYRRLRELAKRHQCAVIGVSQASADGEGKTRIDFSMAEGSKTGKAAEADIILGIGKHNGDADDESVDYTRFLHISKNKISGFHGTICCSIEPDIGRYVE